MPPPKITVALRVARMLADGWHIEPCERVSPPSHEQRKGGPFPGLAGLPSPRASDCSSVRLPPLYSINSVRGYPSGGQLCSVKRPALAEPQVCECLAVRPGIRSLLARRGFFLLPFHGRDRRQGTCLARPARSARPALPLAPVLPPKRGRRQKGPAVSVPVNGSPPKRGRRPQVVAAPWTWSCGMACEGAQTKESPAERGQNRQGGGIEVLPLGDRAGARRTGARHTKKTPSR